MNDQETIQLSLKVETARLQNVLNELNSIQTKIAHASASDIKTLMYNRVLVLHRLKVITTNMYRDEIQKYVVTEYDKL